MKVGPTLLFAALAGPLAAQTIQWNTDTLHAFDVTETGSITLGDDPSMQFGQASIQDPLGYEGIFIGAFSLEDASDSPPPRWLFNVNESYVQFLTPGYYSDPSDLQAAHLQTDGGFGDAFFGNGISDINELNSFAAPGWGGGVTYSISEMDPTIWNYTITVDEAFTPSEGNPGPVLVPDGSPSILLLALGAVALLCQRRLQAA